MMVETMKKDRISLLRMKEETIIGKMLEDQMTEKTIERATAEGMIAGRKETPIVEEQMIKETTEAGIEGLKEEVMGKGDTKVMIEGMIIIIVDTPLEDMPVEDTTAITTLLMEKEDMRATIEDTTVMVVADTTVIDIIQQWEEDTTVMVVDMVEDTATQAEDMAEDTTTQAGVDTAIIIVEDHMAKEEVMKEEENLHISKSLINLEKGQFILEICRTTCIETK
jgi:hypothetical protein